MDRKHPIINLAFQTAERVSTKAGSEFGDTAPTSTHKRLIKVDTNSIRERDKEKERKLVYHITARVPHSPPPKYT